MDTETFEKAFDRILKVLEESKSNNMESLGLLDYVKNHILKEVE